MGVALVLNADIEDYSVTNGNFDGFKVLAKITVPFFSNEMSSPLHYI